MRPARPMDLPNVTSAQWLTAFRKVEQSYARNKSRLYVLKMLRDELLDPPVRIKLDGKTVPPVEIGDRIDVQYRDGDSGEITITERDIELSWIWEHDGDWLDIMRYRLTNDADIEGVIEGPIDFILSALKRPITSAPLDGTWVLLFGGTTDEDDYGHEGVKTDRPVVAFYDPDCDCYDDETETYSKGAWLFCYWDGNWRQGYDDPTHWMPLP